MIIKEIKVNNINFYLEVIKEFSYNKNSLILGIDTKSDIITVLKFNSVYRDTLREVLKKEDIIEEIYVTEQQKWRSNELKMEKIDCYKMVLNAILSLEREMKINKILKKDGEIEYI